MVSSNALPEAARPDPLKTLLESPWVHVAVVVLVSAGFESLFVHHSMNLMDEGWPLLAARGLHNGGNLYREVFWASGRELGFESIFPANAGWASPRSLHLGFVERKMDGVVAIVDEARARPELEPIRSVGASSAASLEAVGSVTIEALGRIMHRLSRIEAFDSEDAQEEAGPPSHDQASTRLRGIPPSS